MNKIPEHLKHLHGMTLDGLGLVFGKPIVVANQFIGVKEPRLARISRDPVDEKKK